MSVVARKRPASQRFPRVEIRSRVHNRAEHRKVLRPGVFLCPRNSRSTHPRLPHSSPPALATRSFRPRGNTRRIEPTERCVDDVTGHADVDQPWPISPPGRAVKSRRRRHLCCCRFRRRHGEGLSASPIGSGPRQKRPAPSAAPSARPFRPLTRHAVALVCPSFQDYRRWDLNPHAIAGNGF